MVEYFRANFTGLVDGRGTTFPVNTNIGYSEPFPYYPQKGCWNWIDWKDRATDLNTGTGKIISDIDVPGSYCLELKLAGSTSDQSAKIINVQWTAGAYPGTAWDNLTNFTPAPTDVYYNFKQWMPSPFSNPAIWRIFWNIYGAYPGPFPTGQMKLQWCGESQGSTYRGKLIIFVLGSTRASGVDFIDIIMDIDDVPKDQWNQWSIRVKQGSGYKVADGTIEVWLNGVRRYINTSIETSVWGPLGRVDTPVGYVGENRVASQLSNYGDYGVPAGQRLLYKEYNIASDREGDIPSKIFQFSINNLTTGQSAVVLPNGTDTLAMHPLDQFQYVLYDWVPNEELQLQGNSTGTWSTWVTDTVGSDGNWESQVYQINPEGLSSERLLRVVTPSKTSGIITWIPTDPISANYFTCSFDAKPGYGIGYVIDDDTPYPCEKGGWDNADLRGGGTCTLQQDPTGSNLCMRALFSTGAASPNDQSAKLNMQMHLHADDFAGWVANRGGWMNFDVYIPSDFSVPFDVWRMMWQVMESPLLRDSGGPQVCIYMNNDRTFRIRVRYWATVGGVDRVFTVSTPFNIGWNRINIYYELGTGAKTADGTIIMYMDEVEVFNRSDLETYPVNGVPGQPVSEYVLFSLTNYAGGYTVSPYGQGQYFLFKNCVISNTRNTPIYFSSNFTTPGISPYNLNSAWSSTEPVGYPLEKGVWDWIANRRPSADPMWNYAAGTIKLIPDPTNPAQSCLQMIMDGTRNDGSTTRPLSYDQHVKLYELQWNRSGNYNYFEVLTNKEMWYNFKIYLPNSFVVSGWRLWWQIMRDSGTSSSEPGPHLALIASSDGTLYFQVRRNYTSSGTDRLVAVTALSSIPRNQWVAICVYVKLGTARYAQNGTVRIYIDGSMIFDNSTIETCGVTGAPLQAWGIANYGGVAEGYNQYVLFKEVSVSNHLDVVPSNYFDITVLSATGGTTVPAPGVYSIAEGTRFDITAYPSSGYEFTYWLRDGVPGSTTNPGYIIVGADRTLQPFFTALPPAEMQVLHAAMVQAYGDTQARLHVTQFNALVGKNIAVYDNWIGQFPGGWNVDWMYLLGSGVQGILPLFQDGTLQYLGVVWQPIIRAPGDDTPASSADHATQLAITAGTYDSYIITIANECKAFGYPIFIRFGSEMNINQQSNQWAYSPTDYINCWRHVITLFRAQDVPNVEFVWTVNWADDPEGSINFRDYYPGDDYVDWVSVDMYQFDDESFMADPEYELSGLYGDSVYTEYSSRKQFAVTEYAPNDYLWDGTDTSDSLRAAWLTAFFNAVESRPNIKWISYYYAYNYHWAFDATTPLTTAVYQNRIADARYIGPEVTPVVQHTLTIQAFEGQGSVVPIVGAHLYDDSTQATVEATPADQWKFDHWLVNGTDIVTNNPYTFYISADTTIKAYFTLIPGGGGEGIIKIKVFFVLPP